MPIMSRDGSMNSWSMIAYLMIGFLLILTDCALAKVGDLRQQHIGCYRDVGSNRTMGGGISNTSMTLEMCFERCRNTIWTFFGVEFWYDCYCDDKFDKHGPADNCNTPCAGNLSQNCGGDGALSIYTVCPTGKYGQQCNSSCYCKNSSVYGTVCFRNGTCPAGCHTGWNGTKCEQDINECQTISGQKLHNCAHNCTNIPGSYNCTCWPGFTSYDDGRNCTDIDECKTHNGGCNQTCTNTPGSRVCSCNSGYTLIYESQCRDIDECATNRGNCSHSCTNTPGSRTCSCRNGYGLDTDDKTCIDIDECLNHNGGCQQKCNNTIGNFNCCCHQGFHHKNSTHCEDIDECAVASGGCERHCTNTPGSFYCSCLEGYSWNNDSKTCSDVDECLDDTHECAHDCTNLPGSYSCSCRDGFTLSTHKMTCTELPWSASASTTAAVLGIVAVLAISAASIFAYKYYKVPQNLTAYNNKSTAGGALVHNGNGDNAATNEANRQLMSVYELVDTNNAAGTNLNVTDETSHGASLEPGAGYMQLNTKQEAVYVNNTGDMYEAIRKI